MGVTPEYLHRPGKSLQRMRQARWEMTRVKLMPPKEGVGTTYLSGLLLFCHTRNRSSIAQVLSFSELTDSEKLPTIQKTTSK